MSSKFSRDPAQKRAPWHLLAVGASSFALSAFGAYDFVMARVFGAVYQARMNIPPAQIAALQNLPVWLDLLLTAGVASSLAGAFLLLLRKGVCVGFFAASVAGSALGLAGLFGSPTVRAAFGWPMLAVGLASLAIQLALCVYAAWLQRRRILY